MKKSRYREEQACRPTESSWSLDRKGKSRLFSRFTIYSSRMEVCSGH